MRGGNLCNSGIDLLKVGIPPGVNSELWLSADAQIEQPHSQISHPRFQAEVTREAVMSELHRQHTGM